MKYKNFSVFVESCKDMIFSLVVLFSLYSVAKEISRNSCGAAVAALHGFNYAMMLLTAHPVNIPTLCNSF